MNMSFKKIILTAYILGFFTLSFQAHAQDAVVTPQSGSNISYTQTGQNSRIGSYEMLAQLPGFEKVIDKNIDSGGNGDFTLPKYIRTLVRIAIGVIGMLSVVMIVVAGVQYMASEMMTEKEGARQKLTGAVMGLILAVSSVLILRTINPQLLNLDIGKGILLDCVQAKDKDGNLLFYETTKPSTDPKAPPVVPRVIVEKKGTDGKKTYSFVGGGVAPTPTIIKYETEACDKSVVVAEEIEVSEELDIEDNSPAGNASQAGLRVPGLVSAPIKEGPNAKGYYKMPDAPNGEYSFWPNTPEKERWGSRALIDTIYTVAMEWAKKHPEEKILIGDMNVPPPNGHLSHRTGIDVDIYTKFSTGDANKSGSFVSNENKAIELGKMFADTKNIFAIYYNVTTVQQAVNTYANGVSGHALYQRLGSMMFTQAHHFNHFHVRIPTKFKGVDVTK